MNRDPRIDAYIARQADFARPILDYVRALVHEACPDVEETMKWNMPTFVYGGGILCGMAAFRQHASFGYWKHALVVGEGEQRDGMGSYGRLASLRDLPPKEMLLAHIRKAMRLNLEGTKAPRAAGRAPKPLLEIPDDLATALAGDRAARATFEAFAPSHRRDYIEWIIQAKGADTRARRVAQAVEWMAEGKRRNWKYESR